MATVREDGKIHIRFGETLDISVVETLHSEFCAAIDNCTPVSLDAAKVVHIDAAALQVLAAMFTSVETQRQNIEWQSHSDALLRAAALLGLTEHFRLNSA